MPCGSSRGPPEAWHCKARRGGRRACRGIDFALFIKALRGSAGEERPAKHRSVNRSFWRALCEARYCECSGNVNHTPGHLLSVFSVGWTERVPPRPSLHSAGSVSLLSGFNSLKIGEALLMDTRRINALLTIAYGGNRKDL